MNRAVAIACLFLAGCEPAAVKEAKAAEQRLALVKAGGTLDDACRAANDVRDAWLKALDQNKYQMAGTEAALQCNEATLAGGDLPADRQLRDKVQRESSAVMDAAANAAAAVEKNAGAIE